MNETKVFEDLKVDLNCLDEDAANYATLYAEYSLMWVKAVKTRDDLKRQLELLRSDLDEMIRAEPSKYGWEKDKAPTEGFVSQRVINDPDYIDLNEQFAEAQSEVNGMSVIKEAFDKKGYALKILADLYKGNYFTTAVTDLKNTFSEGNAAQVQEAQNEALKKNIRLRRRDQ
jgi:hypothetical protein